MFINLRSGEEKDCAVEVSPSTTISELKSKYALNRPGRHLLIYNGTSPGLSYLVIFISANYFGHHYSLSVLIVSRYYSLSGRLLRDDETIGGLKMEGGECVNMVVRSEGAQPHGGSVPQIAAGRSRPAELRGIGRGPGDNQMRIRSAMERLSDVELDLLRNISDDLQAASQMEVGDAAAANTTLVSGQRREGDANDLVVGFAIGLLLGFLAVLCLLEGNTPRRMKMGIVFGLLANAYFSVAQRNSHHRAAAEDSDD